MKKDLMFHTLFKVAVALYVALVTCILISIVLFFHIEQSRGNCTTAVLEDISNALIH